MTGKKTTVYYFTFSILISILGIILKIPLAATIIIAFIIVLTVLVICFEINWAKEEIIKTIREKQ
jgi:hypothetical protein